MPSVVTSTTDLTWPLIDQGESFLDKALANGLTGDEEGGSYANGDASGQLDAWAKEEEDLLADGDDDVEDGWDLDAGGGQEDEGTGAVDEDEIEEEVLGDGADPGVKEAELWVRNSPLAVDHVSAGNFESAMQVKLFSLQL